MNSEPLVNYSNRIINAMLLRDGIKLAESLSHSAAINTPGSEGLTPLGVACSRRPEYVETLLKNGVDVNAKVDASRSALGICVEERNIKLLRMLLRHGTSLSMETPARGFRTNALHDAVIFGMEDVVDLFANERPDELDMFDSLGRTALMISLGENRLDIASRLLKAGASPNLQDDSDSAYRTASTVAARYCSLEAFELLETHGANFGLRDGYGRTAREILTDRTDLTSAEVAGIKDVLQEP